MNLCRVASGVSSGSLNCQIARGKDSTRLVSPVGLFEGGFKEGHLFFLSERRRFGLRPGCWRSGLGGRRRGVVGHGGCVVGDLATWRQKRLGAFVSRVKG